jgi:hypothetical protein
MSKLKVIFLAVSLFLLPQASASVAPTLFWSYDTGSTVTGVAISDGGVYTAAASSNGYLYFLNNSKTLMWKVETDGIPFKVAVSSDGKRIIVGDGSSVYLYNKTGHLLWDFLIADDITDISITPSGDRIAVGSLNSHVYLFNNNGGLLWKYKTNGPVVSAAISADGKYVAAGTTTKITYMLTRDGNLLWEHIGKRSVDGLGILGTQLVAGERYPTFLEDGNSVGSFTSMVCDITGIKTTADDEYVLIGCGDGEIYMLDSNRKKQWSYDAGKASLDSSISPKGDFAVIGAGNTVYMLESPDIVPPIVDITNPRDGEVISGIVEIGVSIVDDSDYVLRILIDGDFACSKLPCNWNTGTATEGEHSIALEVNDSGGNVGTDSVNVNIEHGALGEIAGEIAEKTEIIEDAQDEIKEKEEAVREKIDETVPQNLPPVRTNRDYSGIIKGAAIILIVYAALKFFLPKKAKGRGKGGKYKFKR